MADMSFLNSGEEPPQQGIGGVLNPGMDPVTQAFMLSAGLQLMQGGGWGGANQRIAGALGQGIEAAGGAAAIQEQGRRSDIKTRMAQQELDQRSQMNQADITSREKIAKMYTDQRMATAGGGSGRMNSTEFKEWNKNVNAFQEAYGRRPQYRENPEQLFQDAQDHATELLNAGRAAVGGGQTSPNPQSAAPPVGQPGGQQTPGKTSPNSTPATTPGPQGAVTPRQPGAGPMLPNAPNVLTALPVVGPLAQAYNWAQRAGITPRAGEPRKGGVPFSEVIKNKNLTPEQRARYIAKHNTIPGRKQLEAQGINNDE